MKARDNWKWLGLALMACCAVARSADTGDGTNAGGSERVCGKSAKTLAESFSDCKRGDIIGLTLVGTPGAAAACDFGKAILYSKGEPIACVYIGSVRQFAK